jgi:hypothetical protein
MAIPRPLRHPLLATLLTLACAQPTESASPPRCRADSCVLFVGGSLTWTHDIPGIYAALAKAAGHGDVQTSSVFFGGTDLRDHWAIGAAQEAIAEGGWDVVVLEQGPSALPASRALLREYVGRYDEVIRAAGATTALYMTWPMEEDIENFPASSESWHLAASDVGATLFAVGDAWRATWARDPGIRLYGDDGWHPGPDAAYLAALVMVGRVYAQPVTGLPASVTLPSGGAITMEPAVAAVLQAAADEVNGEVIAAARRGAPRAARQAPAAPPR